MPDRDGRLSGTGCQPSPCTTEINQCTSVDNYGNTIETCTPVNATHVECNCPNTHTGDANPGASGCNVQVRNLVICPGTKKVSFWNN